MKEISDLLYETKRSTLGIVYLIADALKKGKYVEALAATEYVKSMISTMITLDEISKRYRRGSE